MQKEIGKITHYFDKISVAVVELTAGELKLGDTIKIVGKGNEFTQIVESMHVEHQPVESAKRGDGVGLKVGQKVKEGYKVYLMG